MEPRVVLAADHVERPPQEPADDQRPLLGQLTVDGGRGQPGGAGANGQARRAELLSLDGEQSPDDLGRGARPAGVEQLCRGSTCPKL